MFFLRSSVLWFFFGGGNTISLAEEQPLLKEQRLPPDISFLLGKIAVLAQFRGVRRLCEDASCRSQPWGHLYKYGARAAQRPGASAQGAPSWVLLPDASHILGAVSKSAASRWKEVITAL